MSTSPPPHPVLSARDINVSPSKPSPSKLSPGDESPAPKSPVKTASGASAASAEEKPKTMEYHRQVLQSRLEAEKSKTPTYISPSDTIMSPCTAKLSAYKSKHFMKAKPQSLFAKLEGDKSTDNKPRDQAT